MQLGCGEAGSLDPSEERTVHSEKMVYTFRQQPLPDVSGGYNAELLGPCEDMQARRNARFEDSDDGFVREQFQHVDEWMCTVAYYNESAITGNVDLSESCHAGLSALVGSWFVVDTRGTICVGKEIVLYLLKRYGCDISKIQLTHSRWARSIHYCLELIGHRRCGVGVDDQQFEKHSWSGAVEIRDQNQM